MKARRVATLGVLLFCGVAMTRTSMGHAQGVGPYLPDTTLIARVEGRVIRFADFVEAYFASFAEFRPRPDSLGRVEFLTSMVNKEVLALTARAINRPESFEDRLVMREHTERVLANVLYQRVVLDSVVVSDEEVRQAHAHYGWQYRLKHIQFADRARAESARAELLARRIRWSDAVKRYSVDSTRQASEGDLGWMSRQALGYQTAIDIYDLKPGEISRVVQDADGFHLMQLVERRKVEPPAFEPMRLILKEAVRAQRAALLADRFQEQIGRQIGLTHDAGNIGFAAARFRGYRLLTEGPEGTVLDLSGSVPEFAPADTGRVLARHRDGRFSLGDFLHAYHEKSVVQRQPVGDFESFRVVLDAMVLEPYMAQVARARGLASDPVATSQIEKKREQLLVEHLFQDSVQSKVWIPPQERRRYYEEHIAQYTTFPKVRFAAIVRDTKAGADSILARLKAGERAEAILRADSLRGLVSGSIQERRDDEKGAYHKVLFGELRPGQATVVGPDKEGTWMVLHLIDFDPGRQLSYGEAEHYVDESLQNIHAEALLKALIARHEKRYRIEAHPELVMRIRLRDPAVP